MTLTNAGASDYMATTRVTKKFLDIANNTTTSTDQDGWGKGGILLAPAALASQQTIPNGTKIAQLTDGTSNTTMIAEVVGRNTLYRTARQAIPVGVNDEPFFNSLVGGGAWADPFGGAWELSGRNFDGSGADRGPCGINCSNAKVRIGSAFNDAGGLFSFHIGGVQVLLCDGSVRFLSQNMSGTTLGALISRAGSEVLGEF